MRLRLKADVELGTPGVFAGMGQQLLSCVCISPPGLRTKGTFCGALGVVRVSTVGNVPATLAGPGAGAFLVCALWSSYLADGA